MPTGSVPAAMAKLVVLGVVLALGGLLSCEKSTATENPDGHGVRTAAPVGNDIELRYRFDAGKLRQTGTFDINTTGGGEFGAAAIAYTVALDLAAAGNALQVAWDVTDIATLEVQGNFADGGAATEPKAFLTTHGTGAFVVDATGRLDERATESLPSNAARRKRLEPLALPAGAAPAPASGALRLLALAERMVELPELPVARLAVGASVIVDRDEDAEVGGIVLPTATATEYTLVKIDRSGNTRVAELQIQAVTRGATDTPDGKLMVTIDGVGLLLFDVDAGVPVRWQLKRTQTVELGPKGFESTVILESNYDRG